MSSSFWDVIVMDVQIAEYPETGTDHAERAILEYGITSPVIVISGVWLLKDLEKRHPDIFFGYVSKDNLHDSLPDLIDRACRIDSRTDHVKKMATAFAKKFEVLMKEFPLDLLQGAVLKPLCESAGGKTISDLISLIGGATKQQIHQAGKSVLMIIDEMRAKPT